MKVSRDCFLIFLFGTRMSQIGWLLVGVAVSHAVFRNNLFPLVGLLPQAGVLLHRTTILFGYPILAALPVIAQTLWLFTHLKNFTFGGELLSSCG